MDFRSTDGTVVLNAKTAHFLQQCEIELFGRAHNQSEWLKLCTTD